MKLIAAVLVVCILALSAAAPRAQEVVLVADGQNPCPILAEALPPAREWQAATLLAQYLTQISGAKFEAQKGAPPAEGPAILIGSFGSDMAAGLPGDSFVVRTENGRLHIAGATPLGTAFGVFAFLRDDLGCRWWSQNEEDVPKTPTIRLGPMNRTVKAVFRIADLYNREAQDGPNGFPFKSRGISSDHFTGGHNLYPLLTPYAKDHPDIYPYDEKKKARGPNDLHFCYSDPDIAQALADALARQVEADKGEVQHTIYFAGMGDWYGGMCECERCRAIYEEETWTDPDGRKKPGYSGTLLRMINRAGEILEQKYPGVRVGTFAYMSLEAPPGKTVPRANVVIRLPHLRHCILHGIDKCEKNKSCLRNLERWCELAPGRVCLWDYGVDFGENFLYPFPVVTSMADDIRLCARLGAGGSSSGSAGPSSAGCAGGVMIQGNYVSTGGDLVVLKNYVWGRLLWDPSLKTEDVVREFCNGYYGLAADAVYEYVMLLEDAAQKSEKHMDEFTKLGGMKGIYLTDELTPKLRAALDRALAATNGQEPFARRVKEAAVGMEAAELWHGGPLAEKDGRLVRADLDNAYTYPRAVALLEACRNASPREWGAGLSYRQAFLPLHGGPLPTLARGDLTVKVAPVLNCRLYQIAYRGKELLRIGSPKEEGYPLVGGSWDQLNPGPRAGALLGEPTATKVEMEAQCGIGAWAHAPQQIAHKTVVLTEDGAIRVTGVSETPNKRPVVPELTEVTEYAVGAGANAATVEVLLADETWQTVSFAEPTLGEAAGGKDAPAAQAPALPALPEAAVPAGARALRISIPGKACVVEDRYLAPAVAGGGVRHDAKSGVLTTSVTMSKAATEGQWLVREIVIGDTAIK